MFDELRGLDVDVSCENLEITIFSEAVEFTQAHFGFIHPLRALRSLVTAQCFSTQLTEPERPLEPGIEATRRTESRVEEREKRKMI